MFFSFDLPLNWLIFLDKLFVFFPEDQKVGIKTIKTYDNDSVVHVVSSTAASYQYYLVYFRSNYNYRFSKG